MNHLESRPTRLLVRPEHAENESLRGYVSRVSSRNGSSPLLNPMLASLQDTTVAIHEIATLTGCNASLLSEHGSYMQIRHDEHSGVLFGNCFLSPSLVRMQRRSVCPLCLSNNGVSACCWELQDYDVCHEHGCNLVGRCSDCNRLLSWPSTTSENCCCGMRLADIEPTLASSTRRSICKLIANAMSVTINRSRQQNNTSDSLTALNWLFIVINFVLSVLIPAFCQRHLRKICALSNQTCEEILLATIEDSEYYNHTMKVISLLPFRNQMTMSCALRAGYLDTELRDYFLSSLKNFPIPKEIIKIKEQLIERKEMQLRRRFKKIVFAQNILAGIN